MKHARAAVLFAALVSAALPAPPAVAERSDERVAPGAVPRAVTVARTILIPRCTAFVDAAASGRGDGTVARPHRTIAAAVAAVENGAVICVAEGTYAESLAPGEKSFTLAGGFQSGAAFKVRDSARYVTKAKGNGGSFIRIVDPGPKDGQLTAIDGFDISGYSQAIVRDVYYSQRFDITNNYIHDNRCAKADLVGGGFSLNNISGTIHGNVFRNNSCGRGGAGALNDSVNKNSVSIERNLFEGNAGTEPDSAHGGALYLFTNTLSIVGNAFTGNTVTQWGAGLYIGAYTAGNQPTTATLAWNIYRNNRAGNAGGGLFCDDGATCLSDHDIFDGNCGGNIFLDGGPDGSGPTVAKFDHLTNVGALAVGCKEPGDGVRIDKANPAPDSYSFTNAIFWGNAKGRDVVASCEQGCRALTVGVTHSMAHIADTKSGPGITLGPGILAPADPLFADPKAGDFHLKSAAGRWTAGGRVKDDVTSPLIAKGDPRGATDRNPPLAGKRTELGAYGNSGEASYSP